MEYKCSYVAHGSLGDRLVWFLNGADLNPSPKPDEGSWGYRGDGRVRGARGWRMQPNAVRPGSSPNPYISIHVHYYVPPTKNVDDKR